MAFVAGDVVLIDSLANQGPVSGFTIPSFTPVAGRLYLLHVGTSGNTFVTVTSASSSGGLTFAQVASVQNNSTFEGTGNLWRALETSGLSAGAITVTLSGSIEEVSWSLWEIDNVDTSGVDGAGAIGQVGSAQDKTVTLGAFAASTNLTMGFFQHRQDNAVTPGTGFTEILADPFGGGSPFQEQVVIRSTSLGEVNTVAVTATTGTTITTIIGVEIIEASAAPVDSDADGVSADGEADAPSVIISQALDVYPESADGEADAVLSTFVITGGGITAGLAATQAPNTADIEATVTFPPVTGELAATQDDDTMDMAVTVGTVEIVGSLAASQDGDTMDMAGTVANPIVASIAAVQADQIASFAGGLFQIIGRTIGQFQRLGTRLHISRVRRGGRVGFKADESWERVSDPFVFDDLTPSVASQEQAMLSVAPAWSTHAGADAATLRTAIHTDLDAAGFRRPDGSRLV